MHGSAVAVIISMLGRNDQVLTASTLFHKLCKDGFVDVDVYAYTSLITACANILLSGMCIGKWVCLGIRLPLYLMVRCVPELLRMLILIIPS